MLDYFLFVHIDANIHGRIPEKVMLRCWNEMYRCWDGTGDKSSTN